MLTMYDGRTKLAEQVAGEVRKHFGDTVLRTVIPRSVKVSEAPGYGMTILQYDAGSRGALAYLDAAREINARGGPSGPGDLVSTPTAGEAEGVDRPEEN
jgi:chromosome partitioning protein